MQLPDALHIADAFHTSITSVRGLPIVCGRSKATCNIREGYATDECLDRIVTLCVKLMKTSRLENAPKRSLHSI